MAMKDILGRFKRETADEVVPEETPVPEEKPSFVFTDVNSEPIDTASGAAPAAPAHNGPVKVGSSDNDRIQVFELDLGGSKAELVEKPAPEPAYTEVPDIPEPPVIEPDDTITVAPTPAAADGTEEYEVDFGYAAPGALDDVTYTTDPASVPKPEAPEPVVYREEAPADNGEEEYYDSYEPIYEETYTPGSYFANETASAPVEEEYIAPAAAAAAVSEPEPVAEELYETPTYADAEARPRYENYREDYRETPDAEPRSYENNIDDSVFLPDEGETPVFSRKNRRRMTIAVLAVLVALLFVLGGVLISHFKGRSSDDAALSTTAKVKTTAFERSVSNNADATEVTTEEEEVIQYDENGEISSTTEQGTTAQDTTRRTSTASTTRATSTTASTTRRKTSTTSTASTAPSTEPSTVPPSTDPPTTSSRSVPSPGEYISQRNQ